MEEIGNRIKQIRGNLSKSAFAEKLGIKLQYIKRYEEEGVLPTTDFYKRIINTFDVNINWLLTGIGSMYSSAPDKSKDELIDSLKSELLEKENQLTRVREAIGYSESRAKTINTAAKIAAAKLVKGNPGQSLKRK